MVKSDKIVTKNNRKIHIDALKSSENVLKHDKKGKERKIRSFKNLVKLGQKLSKVSDQLLTGNRSRVIPSMTPPNVTELNMY